MEPVPQKNLLLPSFNVGYKMSRSPKEQPHRTSPPPPQDNALLLSKAGDQTPSERPLYISAATTSPIPASHTASINPAREHSASGGERWTTSSPQHPPTSMGSSSHSPPPPPPPPPPPSSSSAQKHVERQPPQSTSTSFIASPPPPPGASPSASVSSTAEATFPGALPSSRGSPAVPSNYEQVRSPSGHSSLASTEQQSLSSRHGSRSSEPGQQASATLSVAGAAVDSSGQPSGRVRRRPKTQVASACWKCKKDHLSCDPGRPCKRCINSGQQEFCYDVPPKKRGRPKLDQRVEPESSSTAVNRKRQRHTYFEIDATTAMQGTGPTESYPRPAQPPPSSYHYHPGDQSGGRVSLSQHSSYGTSSSVYSHESSGDPSSRMSRESGRSMSSQPGREFSTRSNSTASSDRPPPHAYASPPYGHPGSHVRSPAAYNLDNLAATLPPSSPSTRGQQLGSLPPPQYRSHNPVNPQNFGTRPTRPAPGPTTFPFTPSREQLRPGPPTRLPPVAPFQAQQQPSGYPQANQLPAMQPPVQLYAPDPSASFGRTPSVHSQASSTSLPPISSSRPGSERYDPVQEANRHREEREVRDRSHRTARGDETRGDAGRGNGSDHSSGKSGNEGNGQARKQRRALKLSDIVH